LKTKERNNIKTCVIIIVLLFFNITIGDDEIYWRGSLDNYLEEYCTNPISEYDKIIQVGVRRLGWDWRMMASIVWNESRFNINAVSSQGARGLMQFMPRTAERFGLEGEELNDPAKNIEAGVEYLMFLERRFGEIVDRDERIKFVLAGYNAGPGHVRDAMALAEKYGDNPHVWYNSVDKWLLALQERKYYTDEVCRHGFFRGKYTVRYVKNVFEKYYFYKEQKFNNL
jgi:membrane-bound lytic murein transglycosylase F